MLSDKKVRYCSSLLAPAPFVARGADPQTVSGGCQSVASWWNVWAKKQALTMCMTLTFKVLDGDESGIEIKKPNSPVIMLVDLFLCGHASHWWRTQSPSAGRGRFSHSSSWVFVSKERKCPVINDVNVPPPALVQVEQTVTASLFSMSWPHTPPCTWGGVRGEERRAPGWSQGCGLFLLSTHCR